MNAREMLIKQLQDLGADGLCNPEEGCGCGMDDLAPCGCLNLGECKAARWVQPARDSPDYDDRFPDGYYRVMGADR